MAPETTTLSDAQEAADLIALVDDASSREGDFLIQIEEEFQLVERRGLGLNWQVKRGLFGTTPVHHDAASTVTVVRPQVFSGDVAAPPEDADGGVGGGALTVTDGTTTVAAATSMSFPLGQVTDEGGGVASVNTTIAQQNDAVGLDVLGLPGQSDSVVRIRQNDATGDALTVTGEGPDANGGYNTRSLVQVFDWQGNSLLDLRDTGRLLLSASNVGGAFAVLQCKDDQGNLVFQVLNDGSIHIKTGTSLVDDL